jgi:hypothetical protein
MQPNTYPDGFPQSPLDAINFSYFLSDEEKADWRQWLESATAEQQFELVDTLHAMWMENQKSAIPDGFNQNSGNPGQNQSDPSNSNPTSAGNSQPSPVPQSNATQNNSNADEPAKDTQPKPETPVVPPAPAPTSSPTPKEEASAQKPQEETSQKQNKKNNDQNVQEFGDKAYTPNPLINDSDKNNQPETKSQPKQTPQNNDQTNKKNSQRDTEKDSKPNQAKPDQVSKNTTSDSRKGYFNVTKLRESATKAELQELYSEYVELRESSFDRSHSFYEAQGKFLDKVMSVIVNFEQVADFFDSLSEKIIDLNDRLVDQVKDYNTIKGSINTQHGDLRDQVDDLRKDVDRLFRSIRDDKSDHRRQFEDIRTQLATMGADTFGSEDGILQRIDLLSSKLHKLELQQNRSGDSKNPRDQGIQPPKAPGKTNIRIG